MTSGGHLAQLSLSGLHLAAAFGPSSSSTLARWLYSYGRLPRGPAVDRALGPDDEPMAVLGLSRGAPTRRLLERRYVASTDRGWYSFFALTGLREGFDARCKLYVSPRPEALADAFPVVAATFAEADVRSFKVGRGREGLLRADKIVAYFSSPSELADVARRLEPRLTGAPAHGVPFTAELGGGGVLSWGVDPEGGATGSSWRSWVTQRLAHSLAIRLRSSPDPVGAALVDIRADGVDPERWALVSARGAERSAVR